MSCKELSKKDTITEYITISCGFETQKSGARCAEIITRKKKLLKCNKNGELEISASQSESLISTADTKSGKETESKKSKPENAKQGIPTCCTPVPSDEGEDVKKIQQSRFNTNNETCKSDETRVSMEPIRPPVAASSLESSVFRTFVPICIYFQQKKIVTVEMPCDEALKQILIYGLDRIGKKIKDKFSFYAYFSMYDLKWNRPKNSFMNNPEPETIFRLLLKPEMANDRMMDICMSIGIRDIPKINIYIFMKSFSKTPTISEISSSNHWNFSDVYNPSK